MLAFAEESGVDTRGTGLGLTQSDPLWGRASVNVATVVSGADSSLALTTNSKLVESGYFKDPPLVFNPDAKLIRHLMARYTKALRKPLPPRISGGGTYAKRLPSSIAFGMWFPGKPYPGHSSDEANSL